MKTMTGKAPGKIILSGEYAVVFGHPGIAIPSTRTVEITFNADRKKQGTTITWDGIEGDERWNMHIHHILHECQKFAGKEFHGTLHVENTLPLGKGMGSSTAFLIATVRSLLGDNTEEFARALEEILNPGHSGLDFAVIWHGKPVMFQHGKPHINPHIPSTFLERCMLIDSGAPNEPTPELVAWVKSRKADVNDILETIGKCTERLAKGDNPLQVLRDHHRAQVGLGVVPSAVQKLVDHIEKLGGAAKVAGAGAKSGGGGIVLVFHSDPNVLEEEIPLSYAPMRL
jgi:mevalonate kinase